MANNETLLVSQLAAILCTDDHKIQTEITPDGSIRVRVPKQTITDEMLCDLHQQLGGTVMRGDIQDLDQETFFTIERSSWARQRLGITS